MATIGLVMPGLVAAMALVREFSDVMPSSTEFGSLALMASAGIYVQQSVVRNRREMIALAVLIANFGLLLLWRSVGLHAIELTLVPIGLSLLGLVEVFKDRLPMSAHTPIRSIAAAIILCSPIPEVIGGHWIAMLTLLGLSVLVTLLAIGLRLRSLMCIGTVLLMADLIAMVVRSTADHLNVLWILGVGLGIAVIALAAYCENHRETLLARVRLLSAELATWE
jgi:hypothetical protein